MITVLLGGPGHLTSVDADPGAQVYELSAADGTYRYRRKHWSNEHGTLVRAYFVHADLSEGEVNALLMVHAHSF